MRLYNDDKLVSADADAPMIEAALARLGAAKEGSVELRRSADEYLRALRSEPGYYGLELAEKGCVSGIVLGVREFGEARTAFLEFLFELTPAIFAEDARFDDDCRLCRPAQRELRRRGARQAAR